MAKLTSIRLLESLAFSFRHVEDDPGTFPARQEHRMATFAYGRVSTRERSVENQRREIVRVALERRGQRRLVR